MLQKENKKMTKNMLNLPSFKIIDMQESESDYRFLVETTLPPSTYCPKCGTIANLYKHGKKKQLFSIYQCTQNVSVFMSIVLLLIG